MVTGDRRAGPLSQLALTFDASSHEPVIRGIAVKKAAAQGRVEGGAVTLSSAAIELGGGRVTGAATFGLGAESTSSATLRWDRVALAGVLQALAIPSAVPMGARLDGDASMTWNHRGLPSLALAATTRALPDAT